MNTQVTKKKKLTLKTKRATRRPVDAGEQVDGAASAPAPAAAAAAGAGRGKVDSSYHKIGAIFAILATLIFIGLIALQVLEWLYYDGALPQGPVFVRRASVTGS
ncbi:MAG: hypothetical protein QGI24_07400 [Kiritimatiellia bacterium]|jgi:hypothetical protein|nr:hypothetical protein [Kiritimatiellia bacterium]MDP6848597.1 hypothetical protein [Kiritimatiellia bacterium]